MLPRTMMTWEKSKRFIKSVFRWHVLTNSTLMYHILHTSLHSRNNMFFLNTVRLCSVFFVGRFVFILLVMGINHRVRSTTDLDVQARIRNGSKQKLYVRDRHNTNSLHFRVDFTLLAFIKSFSVSIQKSANNRSCRQPFEMV